MNNEFSSSVCRHLGIFVVALLIGVYSTLAVGQTDEELLSACGRQAKEAGITGAAAVSAYVATCVAGKQAQRTLSEVVKDKDKGKSKDKEKTKDKQKSEKKDKRTKKDKKS